MPVRDLIDENLRERLALAAVRHNARGIDPIDVVQVGDLADLPLGAEDPEILIWAEREEWILVSSDLSSLPIFLSDHIKGGTHSPGVFLVKHRSSLAEVLDFLVLAAHASEAWEWRDRCQFIPI